MIGVVPDLEAPACNSMLDDEKLVPTCHEILFAVIVWAPWQALVTIIGSALVILQQFIVLPFRVCGGHALTSVLRLFAPLMSTFTFLTVTANTYEYCYGREVKEFESYDDFLQSCSTSRRKNIKRNVKAAEQALQRRGIEVSYHPAGSWRLASEHRALIWKQCKRHANRARGPADIMNCGQPISPTIMYVGEIMFLLIFPCDIQLFRTQDGTLISLNTRVHVGNVYFNPNYATDTDYTQDGIYCWSNRHMVSEAIRLRANVLNLMPSMQPAKEALGMECLSLCTLIRTCWTCGWNTRLTPGIKRQTKEPASISVRSARKAKEALRHNALQTPLLKADVNSTVTTGHGLPSALLGGA